MSHSADDNEDQDRESQIEEEEEVDPYLHVAESQNRYILFFSSFQ